MDGAAAERSEDRSGRSTAVPIGFLDQLSRTTSRQEVFAAYARWTHEILECDRATVAVAEAGDTSLTLMAIEGNQAIATGASLPVDGSFLGHTFVTRQGGYLHHIEKSPYFECPKLSSGGILSIVNAPMVVGERCFGCLAIGRRDPEGVGARDVTILGALARCLASYLLLHEQIDKLSELALKDPLTRLHNRRFFEETIAAAWQSWSARGRRFALVIIDIDHFKAINDTYGHPFGDKVLCDVAELLRAEARPQDAVTRMGGEEFALILTDVTQDQALAVAERVRGAVEAHLFEESGNTVRVTISLGVATANSSHSSHDALTLEADTMLYAAKEAGRNRVWPDRNAVTS